MKISLNITRTDASLNKNPSCFRHRSKRNIGVFEGWRNIQYSQLRLQRFFEGLCQEGNIAFTISKISATLVTWRRRKKGEPAAQNKWDLREPKLNLPVRPFWPPTLVRTRLDFFFLCRSARADRLAWSKDEYTIHIYMILRIFPPF